MKIKLLRSIQETGNAYSYFFSLPSKDFKWIAGQYVSLTLGDTHNDTKQNTHWFTIASAPESREIQITTRISDSPFKSILSKLSLGSEVTITKPEGDFIWKDSNRPAVFIAGGIGITPFNSILQSRKLNNLNTRAHLIYINRDENYIFKDSFEEIKSLMPGLSITYLIGGLTLQRITETIPDINNSVVYFAGPEPMVESIGNELIGAGLSKESLVRDWFPGYDEKNF